MRLHCNDVLAYQLMAFGRLGVIGQNVHVRVAEVNKPEHGIVSALSTMEPTAREIGIKQKHATHTLVQVTAQRLTFMFDSY